MKKAEGLALQTVVVAAIVLVVLVVVIMIFTGGIGKIRTIDQVNDCKATGSTCEAAGKCGAGTVAVYGLGCEKTNLGSDKKPLTPYCCKKNEPTK